jgi:hypothetical protein
MAITSLTPKQRGEERQSSLVGVVDFTGDDINSNSFTPIFQMPKGAILMSVVLCVREAFTASSTADVGYQSSPDGLLDDIDLATVQCNVVQNLPSTEGHGGVIGITAAGVSGSGGAGTLLVEYIRASRAHSTQG